MGWSPYVSIFQGNPAADTARLSFVMSELGYPSRSEVVRRPLKKIVRPLHIRRRDLTELSLVLVGCSALDITERRLPVCGLGHGSLCGGAASASGISAGRYSCASQPCARYGGFTMSESTAESSALTLTRSMRPADSSNRAALEEVSNCHVPGLFAKRHLTNTLEPTAGRFKYHLVDFMKSPGFAPLAPPASGGSALSRYTLLSSARDPIGDSTSEH